ncbi:hypothetical protein ACVC95_003370, partial [Shigella dysenteriae]
CIKTDHAERENTGVEGKAEKLTWHKARTGVSLSFSISYTSSNPFFKPAVSWRHRSCQLFSRHYGTLAKQGMV